MATAKERILALLAADNLILCDDCISPLARVMPRQQVNQICRALRDSKVIERRHGTCGNCEKTMLVNKSLAVGSRSPQKLDSYANPIDRDKRINDIHHQLNQLLRRLKPLPKYTGLNDHINQLLQENLIPNYVATLMHAVRKLRNDFIKERVHFSDSVFAAFEANWLAIQEWARK